MPNSIDIRVLLIGAVALLIALHDRSTDNDAKLTGLFSAPPASLMRCGPPAAPPALATVGDDDITGSIAPADAALLSKSPPCR